MPLFYLFILLHCSVLLFAQKEYNTAVARIQKLALAAHEREAQLKDTLAGVRSRIREGISNPETLLEFDAAFSGLVKRDRNKQSISNDIQIHINQVLPLDSLVQLIVEWQQHRLQSLRLFHHSFAKENFDNQAFIDTSEVLQFLSFFDIQNQEKVAELGAGSGWLSMLMCILYDSIALHVNELGDYNLHQVRNNFISELSKTQLRRCHFARGSKISTGLETEALDLIIAVDVFHHFSDKINMLQSIKWSLAKEGRLCLVEQVKTINTGDYYCPQALEKWELEELLRQNGFVKTKEQLLKGKKDQNIYLLEYQINPL